ncbi:MAG: ABC transporter ATP-binding protein [Amaricoccus sp.]|uniref:ABC transporter ATP-binding protein n=1 Tax=Amaricoccus sp. TaxID=1872485 RepID=UPI0039E287B0
MLQPDEETGPALARPPILDLRGVSKSYAGQPAVHPVDLSIDQGEFITLLGPSGCGKTSLLRVISGFNDTTDGRIYSRGVDITRLRPERRPFNMVFQSYALFPHLDVFENVAYGLRAAGVAPAQIRERVDAALEMVGLSAHRHSPVTSLSGGMSQRVALMRAIVMQPAILLLDEPLAALDLRLRKRMQLELRGIQRRLDTTFILVTHDQEEALVMSDRIVVMNRGRIEQVGTPREIYFRPQTRFVAEFVGEASFLSCRVTAREGTMVRVVTSFGWSDRFACHARKPASPGDAGAVSFRPEQLSLTAPGEGDLHGEVRDLVFTGSATLVSVAVAEGVELRLAAAHSPAVGERVGIRYQPGTGVFTPDPAVD